MASLNPSGRCEGSGGYRRAATLRGRQWDPCLPNARDSPGRLRRPNAGKCNGNKRQGMVCKAMKVYTLPHLRQFCWDIWARLLQLKGPLQLYGANPIPVAVPGGNRDMPPKRPKGGQHVFCPLPNARWAILRQGGPEGPKEPTLTNWLMTARG